MIEKILIDPIEWQTKLLDYLSSDDFENMFNSTRFNYSDECKEAMKHGLVMATIIANCRCKQYGVTYE